MRIRSEDTRTRLHVLWHTRVAIYTYIHRDMYDGCITVAELNLDEINIRNLEIYWKSWRILSSFISSFFVFFFFYSCAK